jgi:hypothetical protein
MVRECVYVACIIFIVPPCECKVRGRDSTVERLGSSLQGKHNDRHALLSAVVSTFKTSRLVTYQGCTIMLKPALALCNNPRLERRASCTHCLRVAMDLCPGYKHTRTTLRGST